MVSVLSETKKTSRRRFQLTKHQNRLKRYRLQQKTLIQSTHYTYPDENESKNNSSYEVFYSIYRGWNNNYTACFLHPIYAIIWMRWMLWKDQILHLWKGEIEFPEWHSLRFV